MAASISGEQIRLQLSPELYKTNCQLNATKPRSCSKAAVRWHQTQSPRRSYMLREFSVCICVNYCSVGLLHLHSDVLSRVLLWWIDIVGWYKVYCNWLPLTRKLMETHSRNLCLFVVKNNFPPAWVAVLISVCYIVTLSLCLHISGFVRVV